MSNINWENYVNHIFCLNYLQNNRLNDISQTLLNIGVNINNPKFFSFVYDYEHCIFKDQYQIMKNMSFDCFNKKAFFPGSYLDKDIHDYIFYLGLNTYRALKIAQYFKYERIIIFEDDIIFLKDKDYIINAMNFVNSQQFDVCLCQTTFMDAWHGIKSYLVNFGNCVDYGNDMFLGVEIPIGLYGGGFIILSKEGINKIINYYEQHDMIVCIDALDTVRNDIKLNTLFALKPLCIQKNMIDEWSEEQRKEENINMDINEYE